jgi:lipoprotein NlpI
MGADIPLYGPTYESPTAKGRLGVPRLSLLCGLALLGGLLACSGCGDGAATFLGAQDRVIKDSTHAIQTARDDTQRSKAYSSRGTAYSEEARYSRLQKLISTEKYERLFDLAIRDHDQAVALNPASAEAYFNRAQTYYDRGSGDLIYDTNPYAGEPRNNRWLSAAAADFAKVIAKDPSKALAFDRLGLAYESNGEADKAIRAYTQELALDNHLGKRRLANAYCVIGYERQLKKDFRAAVEAYQKSTEFDSADDKTCPIEPFEALERLKRNSGRSE